jgi:hypothetical protein
MIFMSLFSHLDWNMYYKICGIGIDQIYGPKPLVCPKFGKW